MGTNTPKEVVIKLTIKDNFSDFLNSLNNKIFKKYASTNETISMSNNTVDSIIAFVLMSANIINE